MNTRALAPLSAALVMLTALAGCGQTGPLYMPDDQAARAKYDPANDYAPSADASTDDKRDAPITEASKASPMQAPAAPSHSPEVQPAQAAKAPVSHEGAAHVTPAAAPTTSATPAPRSDAVPTAPTAAPTVSPAKKWSTIEWTPYRAGIDQ